jgi:hypothetical protein
VEHRSTMIVLKTARMNQLDWVFGCMRRCSDNQSSKKKHLETRVLYVLSLTSSYQMLSFKRELHSIIEASESEGVTNITVRTPYSIAYQVQVLSDYVRTT